MNTIVLDESEKQRIQKILDCDLTRQKQGEIIFLISSPIALFGLLIFFGAVLENSSSFMVMVPVVVLSASAAFFIGLARLGYYRLFRIICYLSNVNKEEA